MSTLQYFLTGGVIGLIGALIVWNFIYYPYLKRQVDKKRSYSYIGPGDEIIKFQQVVASIVLTIVCVGVSALGWPVLLPGCVLAGGIYFLSKRVHERVNAPKPM